jgi:hypothetical protein
MQQRLNSAVSKPPKSQHPARQMWQLQEPPDLHRNPALAGRCPTSNLARSTGEKWQRRVDETRQRSSRTESLESIDSRLSLFRLLPIRPRNDRNGQRKRKRGEMAARGRRTWRHFETYLIISGFGVICPQRRRRDPNFFFFPLCAGRQDRKFLSHHNKT